MCIYIYIFSVTLPSKNPFDKCQGKNRASRANKAVLDLPLGGSDLKEVGLAVSCAHGVYTCMDGEGRKDRFKEVLIEIFIRSLSTRGWVGGRGWGKG